MSKLKKGDNPAGDVRRRVYEKPTVTRVELRADEAFLGGCKTGFIAGPAQATCDTPSDCSAITS